MLRISEFQFQDKVTTTLAIRSKQTRKTQAGNPYLHLDLSDRTGQITAKVWDASKSSIAWESIETGGVYLFTGIVEEYQGQQQFIVQDIDTVDSFDISDFIASIEEDPKELWKELNIYLSDMTNPFLVTLAKRYLQNEPLMARFRQAPAAKSVHDDKLGGLLRHTTRLVRLSREIIELYPEMHADKDLITLALLLHDFEKITEFSWDKATIQYTDTGHFIGHAGLSMIKVYHEIQAIEGFPDLLRDHLIHIIASHAAEFDPIRLPGTPEAMIVHYCDLVDSQLVHFKQEWDKNAGQGWKKDGLVDRYCYYPEKIEEPKKDPETLF